MHVYSISWALIVNGQPGTGSSVVEFERPMRPNDLQGFLGRVHKEAQAYGSASMPNVTSIWKFED